MIVAKWPVDCVGCPRKIEPGEDMFRASDGGYVHASCAGDKLEIATDDFCAACWASIGDCECRVRRVAS